MLLLERDAAAGHTGLVLHLELAGEVAAPHGLDEAAVFLLQLLGLGQRVRGIGVLVEVALGLVEQALLHGLEQLGDARLELVERDGDLLAVVAADGDAVAGLDVLRADLDAQRHALHLPVGKLPAGAVVAEIALRAQAGGLQARDELLGLLGHAGLVRCDGQHDHLDRRDVRRQDEAAVIAVGHDQAADDPRGHTPRGLVRIGLLVVLVGVGDVERAGEPVAEVVARAGLERLVVVHHALDRIGVHGAGELLLVGLVAADDGHGQLLLAGIGINFEHLQRLLAGLGLGGVQGVALLPEELTPAQERTGSLLPAHDAAPLVIQARQIAPAVHDVAPVLAEERLGRRAHAQALRQLLAAAHRDPRALGREALDVVLLLLQQALGDQHRHGHVLVTGRLELAVEYLLDVLPDGVAIRAQDEQALDIGIVHQLRLGAHVGEPLGEVHFHIGDLLDLLIFGHKRNTPL